MDHNDSETRSGVTMGSDYWISYTDIMTALLFIFILIIFFFIFNYRSIVTNYEKMLSEHNKDLMMNYISKSDLSKNYISRSEYNRLLDINNEVRSKILLLEQENKRIKENNNLNDQLSYNYQKLLAEHSELLERTKELEKYKQIKEEGFEADRKIIELLKTIRNELINDYGIKVELNETNKTLSIDSNVVGFEPGRHEIQGKYKYHVYIISKILQEKLRVYQIRKNIDAIFIEGYTDDQPLDKRETFGNWGLSALRAISFWYSLKTNFPDLSKLRSANGKKLLFSVSGYANVRPIECTDFLNTFNWNNSYSYERFLQLSNNCQVYQYCMIENVDSPDKCRYFKDNEQKEYDTKNRRIGIRFIPYHKRGSE